MKLEVLYTGTSSRDVDVMSCLLQVIRSYVRATVRSHSQNFSLERHSRREKFCHIFKDLHVYCTALEQSVLLVSVQLWYCVRADRTHVLCVQDILCTAFDNKHRQCHVLDKYKCVEDRTSCAFSFQFEI